MSSFVLLTIHNFEVVITSIFTEKAAQHFQPFSSGFHLQTNISNK